MPIRIRISILACLSCLPGAAHAQCLPVFERELDTIPIFGSLGPVEGAWSGGWQNPRPQLLDVDGDDDLDLFVAEETGQLRFFRNDGGVATPDFTWVDDDHGGVHELYFARFVDLDSDGDYDLLVQAPVFDVDVGGISVQRTGAYLYVNTGTPAAPVYENLSSHPLGFFADEDGAPIPFQTTAPDFVDLEGDGDPDLMFGEPSGSLVLYRNVGTPTDPSFRFETDRYEDIIVVFGVCSPDRSEPMTLGELLRSRGPTLRHGFMLFSFHDLNTDGRPDLFIGDQFNSNVYHLLNIGGSPNPGFACQTEDFFPNRFGGPGVFSQYLVSAFGDLDDDGDSDALLGSGASNDRGLSFFRNDGTPQAPLLAHVSDDYLPELDGGKDSTPAFGDLDGDLLPDLYVGFGSTGRVAQYGNIGSDTSPLWAELDPFWLDLSGGSWAAPEFADIDTDGDQDVFVGVESGGVRFLRNDPAGLLEITDDPAFGDVVGRTIRDAAESQAAPAFQDTDGDGDLDLVVGYWDFQGNPTLLHFRNDGGPLAHDFVLAGADFQGIGSFGQNLVPRFGDLDGDGDGDLVVGTLEGTVELFRNVSTAGAPAFTHEPGAFGLDVGASAAPALADVDADGDLDLIVGESGGGLNFYRNVSSAANPSSYALVEPAADAAADGRVPLRFDWGTSIDPVTGSPVSGYELRIARSPSDPSADWRVISRTGSEASIALNRGLFRFDPELWWTVAAGASCRSAPVPEWRRLVNSAAVQEAPGESGGDLDRPDVPTSEPVGFALQNAFPSPTRGNITFRLALPADGHLRADVHDATGRLVTTLHDGPIATGIRDVVWVGRTSSGVAAGPGVFVFRAEFGGRVETRRFVRLR